MAIRYVDIGPEDNKAPKPPKAPAKPVPPPPPVEDAPVAKPKRRKR